MARVSLLLMVRRPQLWGLFALSLLTGSAQAPAEPGEPAGASEDQQASLPAEEPGEPAAASGLP